MSKYNFSPAERHAVYVTHNEKCYMCKKPVDYSSYPFRYVMLPHDLVQERGWVGYRS